MSRNLIIVRAGDGSLHEGWLGDGPSGFDLIVSYYGDDPHRFRNPRATRIDQKGGKFDGLHGLFSSHPELLSRYDYVWLADDDIAAQPATIDRLFEAMAKHDLVIAQPALSWDSYFAYPVTLHVPGFELRYSNFVEAMVPCFRADYLQRVWPLFRGFRFGWGMGVIWTRLMPEPPRKAAIIDSCVVRHTRQLQSGSLYRVSTNPLSERKALFRRFGVAAMPVFGAYGGISTASEPVAMTPEFAAREARNVWSRLDPRVVFKWPRRRFLDEFVAQHRETVDLFPLREVGT